MDIHNYKIMRFWLSINVWHITTNTSTIGPSYTPIDHSHKFHNGPLTRYAKVQVAHAPGMPGTFSPPPRVSDPGMHHGTCVTHVPWCMPGSLTSGFLGGRWRGKRSRHSRRMRNPQFYVSGKRPMHPSHISYMHHPEQKCDISVLNDALWAMGQMHCDGLWIW